jgi:hypothetical protein
MPLCFHLARKIAANLHGPIEVRSIRNRFQQMSRDFYSISSKHWRLIKGEASIARDGGISDAEKLANEPTRSSTTSI